MKLFKLQNYFITYSTDNFFKVLRMLGCSLRVFHCVDRLYLIILHIRMQELVRAAFLPMYIRDTKFYELLIEQKHFGYSNGKVFK